jgi:hypothetical protein
MNSLEAAFEAHEPLKIIQGNSQRVIAEGFVVPGGIVFWDIGWFESPGHPNHFVPGEISGQGPWKIGSAIVEEIRPGQRLFERDWRMWQAFRRSPEGKGATRALAKKFTEKIHVV